MNRKSPSSGSTSFLRLTDSSLGGEEFDAEGGLLLVALIPVTESWFGK
jgi:hypothetical protein